jgi:5-methylthioadenosine/S-adenosylhomocysteine deaminase
MDGIVLRNCDVLAFQDREPFFSFEQDIIIQGNKITSIHPTSEEPSPQGTQILDAQGLLAVPGMVNTHAHVPMVLFRGSAEDVTLEAWFNDYIFPMESNLTPEDVYWGALLGMAEMIEAGITNVADHYFYMDEVAKAVEEAGIRGNLAWAVFEHEGLEKLEETLKFITRWQGKADGRIHTWLGPHSPYLCSPEFLKRCAQEAERLDVGIHLHVAETPDQVRQSREKYGRSPIQILLDSGILERPTILAHCIYVDKADLDIIAAHPAGVGQAPKTYLKSGMGIEPLKKYLSRGIPIGLATDGAASNSTLDLYEQMRLMALTQKLTENDATAMPIEEILAIAYLGGPQVCQEAHLGNLVPGNIADIALLRQDASAALPRLNPGANLLYTLNARDVDTVICDGRVLMNNKELLTIDKEAVKTEVESRVQRLVQRVPGKKVAVYPT